MKILITGSEGQVGKDLVSALEGFGEIKALNRGQLDVSDHDAIKSFVLSYKPDVIVNSAAYTSFDGAEVDQKLAYKVNANGPGYLAKAAKEIGSVIIHFSSDYVFSGEKLKPYDENDEPSPLSVYGKSKLQGEVAVAKECHRHLIIRASWIFGKHGNNFVKAMLKLGSTQNEVSVVCDQIGAPTYSGDICYLVRDLIKRIDKGIPPKWGVYHYSGTPFVSWYEFAEEIFDQAVAEEIIKRKPKLKKITSSEFPSKAKRPLDSRLDCQLIKKELGINPSDWRKALEDIKEYVVDYENI